MIINYDIIVQRGVGMSSNERLNSPEYDHLRSEFVC